MTIRILALLSVLTVTCLTGCDPVMAPHPGQPDLLAMQDYPNIVVTSDLHKWLAFTSPNIQGPPDKPMHIVTPVRLLDDKAVNAQYRYIFFDQTGNPMKPEMEWRYMRLPARVQVFLEGSSLDVAFGWRLEVRTAR